MAPVQRYDSAQCLVPPNDLSAWEHHYDSCTLDLLAEVNKMLVYPTLSQANGWTNQASIISPTHTTVKIQVNVKELPNTSRYSAVVNVGSIGRFQFSKNLCNELSLSSYKSCKLIHLTN